MFPDAKALVVQNKGLRLAFAGSKQFVRKQPLVAKALPTAFGFAFGDVLTQYMNWRNGSKAKTPEFKYEWQRGVKMAVAGTLVAAPIGLGLLRYMDAHLMTSNPNGLDAVSAKFTLDQIVGCMIWQLSYCIIHPPYRASVEEMLSSVQSSLESQSAGVKRKLQLQSL